MRYPPPRIALLLVAAAASAAHRPVTAQEITGVVVEHTTDHAVPDVAVRLLDGEGRAVDSTLSDEDGRFRLAVPRAGTWGIAAERVGYGKAGSDSLAVPDHGTLDIEIRLSIRPLALDSAIRVTASPSFRNADIEEFHRRRLEGSGFGHFIHGEAIERGIGGSASDLLQSVPGVRISSGRPGAGSIVRMRAGCVPAVYIDGMQINRLSLTESMDTYVSVQNIEGIEVYRGHDPGGRFFDRRGCGLVLIWTRRGEGNTGGPGLRRILLFLGLFGAAILLR